MLATSTTFWPPIVAPDPLDAGDAAGAAAAFGAGAGAGAAATLGAGAGAGAAATLGAVAGAGAGAGVLGFSAALGC